MSKKRKEIKSIDDLNLDVHSNKVYYSNRNFEDEIIYFLMVDRFHDGKCANSLINSERKVGYGTEYELSNSLGGTIKGITSKLNYIKNLGFTAIWISPVFENNPESYHGYAIQNFLKVDRRFGTKNDLKQLVNSAHLLGMSVYLDVVINHSGNNWYYEKNRGYSYLLSNTYPFGGWKLRNRPLPIELRSIDCYERKGSIQNWDNYPETQEGDFFTLKKFKLDQSDQGKFVQSVLTKIYCYWIKECDFDGFRLDTAKHISPETVTRFCAEVKRYAASLGKNSFPIFIEAPISDQSMNLYFDKGEEGPDTALDFQLHYYLPKIFEGEEFPHKILNRWDSVNDQLIKRGKLATYLVTFMDNHDQIEDSYKQRIAHRLDDKQLIACFAFLLFYPGIPCLYYGTEQGLAGHGFGDKFVREAMFNSKNNQDLFDESSFLYQSFQKLINIRRGFLTSQMKNFGINLISVNGQNFKRKRKYRGIISFYRRQEGGDSFIYCYNLAHDAEEVVIKCPFKFEKIIEISGNVISISFDNQLIKINFEIKNYIILKLE